MRIEVDIRKLEDELCDLKMMASSMRQVYPDGSFNHLMEQILIKSANLSQILSAIMVLKSVASDSTKFRM